MLYHAKTVKDMSMTKIRVLTKQQANNIKGQTDPEIVRKLTDDDIRKAAMSDPDAPLLTEYQRTQFKPFMFLRKKLRL